MTTPISLRTLVPSPVFARLASVARQTLTPVVVACGLMLPALAAPGFDPEAAAPGLLTCYRPTAVFESVSRVSAADVEANTARGPRLPLGLEALRQRHPETTDVAFLRIAWRSRVLGRAEISDIAVLFSAHDASYRTLLLRDTALIPALERTCASAGRWIALPGVRT